MNKLDKILTVVYISAVIFIGVMCWLSATDHIVPETFACAVIAAFLGECGICGWIKNAKEKTSDQKREDQLHKRDRKEMKEDNE